MQKRRLKRLIALLRADARKQDGAKFDLNTWAAPSDGPLCGFLSATKPTGTPEVSCGTSACAMGLAVISHEFDKEGLYADYISNGFIGLQPAWRMEPAIVDKDGNTVVGFPAAEALFNITAVQAEWLFSPTCYPEDKRKGAEGERYVANRINRLIRTNGKLPAGINKNRLYELHDYCRKHY